MVTRHLQRVQNGGRVVRNCRWSLKSTVHGKISLIIHGQLGCIEVDGIVPGIIRMGGACIVVHAIPEEPRPHYPIPLINTDAMSD
jgi:hypothetical protein